MSTAIYRKYRPQTFKDVRDQNHIKITLQNEVAQNLLAQAYLFTGPRGVGKTTLARLLAKAVNCENRKEGESEPCGNCKSCEEITAGNAFDVIEIDAASHTGVENVRDRIIDNVRFGPTRLKYKIFIIDEVHMLSSSAFNALLKTLEEPPSYAIFILATTELHKVPETIISRCQRFAFKRIATPDLIARLMEIAKSEGVQVEEEVLLSIARLAEGCLRDAESFLGQIIALGHKRIGREEASLVMPVTNTAVVSHFIDAISRSDSKVAITILHEFVEAGGDMRNLTDELIEYAHTMLLLSLGGPYADSYDAETMENMRNAMKKMDGRQMTRLLDELLLVRARPQHESIPQIPLEIAAMRCCDGVIEPIASITPNIPITPPPAPVSSYAPKPQEKPVESVPVQTESARASFSAAELRDKWKRCCEAVSKRNIALPLVLQYAEVEKIEGNEVQIAFKNRFHFDTMNDQKNIRLLTDAVNEIMQSAIIVKPIFVVSKEEEAIENLAEAFGGEIIS